MLVLIQCKTQLVVESHCMCQYIDTTDVQVMYTEKTL